MSKKGEVTLQMFYIMEGLLILFFAGFLFYYVGHVVNDSLFWSNYYVRDNALLIDTITAADGDVQFIYDTIPRKKTPAFLFDFFTKTKDRVSVSDADDKDRQRRVNFPVAQDLSTKRGLTIIDSSFSPYIYHITLQAGKLTVQPQLSPIGCSMIDTRDDISKKRVAFWISDPSVQDSIRRTLSKDYGGPIPDDQLNVLDNADITLALTLADMPPVNVTIYYAKDHNAFETQKLVCILKNKLASTTPPYVVTTRAMDKKTFAETDATMPSNLLERGELSVYLIISKTLPAADQLALGRAVAEALKEHYQ